MNSKGNEKGFHTLEEKTMPSGKKGIVLVWNKIDG